MPIHIGSKIQFFEEYFFYPTGRDCSQCMYHSKLTYTILFLTSGLDVLYQVSIALLMF